jgi:sugar phosphate isomerase/epimerase
MAMYLRDLFARNDVRVAVLGCYHNLATPDSEQLKVTQDIYKTHIRFASLLGCGMVGTETGAVNTEYKPCPENHTDKALAVFVKGLEPIIEYAEKMGVCVGVEPVWKHIMNTPERTAKVIDHFRSPNLRVILDPVNMLNAENECHANEIVDEMFDTLGDEIDVIHLKDYIVKDGNLVTRPVTLGEGRFDFSHLFGIIKKRKPFIDVLLEDSLPENVEASKAYVKKCYEEA